MERCSGCRSTSPNENAVTERSFRTDENEFFYLLEEPPQDINDLNRLFQQYLTVYNTIRTHMGINMYTSKQEVAEKVV